MSDELLVIEASWPGTTIDGEPGIVAGILMLSRTANGELALNVSTGLSGTAPEQCE